MEQITNEEKLIQIFKKHQGFFLKIISLHYPLTKELLEKYKHKLNWKLISQNKNIKWTDDILDTFLNKLVSHYLIKNKGIDWNEKRIKKYFRYLILGVYSSPFLLNKYIFYNLDNLNISNKLLNELVVLFKKIERQINLSDEIINNFEYKEGIIDENINNLDWNYISLNININYNRYLLEKYIKYWNWNLLTTNRKISGSFLIDTIEKYQNEIDLNDLHLAPFSNYPNFIEKNQDKINFFSNINIIFRSESLLKAKFIIKWIDKNKESLNWKLLSYYYANNFSLEFLILFQEYIDWYEFSYAYDKEVSLEFITKLQDKIDWNFFSSKALDKDILEKFEHKLDWEIVFNSMEVIFSKKQIKKYQDKIDFSRLSYNTKIDWDYDLLETFKNKWNWKILSKNVGMNFEIDILEIYEDKWSWEDISLGFYCSREIIEKYSEKLNWELLLCNPLFPISKDFLEKYKDKIEFIKNKRKSYYDKINKKEEKMILKGNIPDEIAYFYQKIISKNALNNNLDELDDYTKTLLFDSLKSSSFCDSVVLTEEFLEKFENNINWYAISQSDCVTWTLELLYKYKDKLSWCNLSKKENLPWSEEILDKFEAYLDWEQVFKNKGVKIKSQSLYKYQDKIKFKNGIIPLNKKYNSFISFIRENVDNIDWDFASENLYFPWTEDFIKEFENYIDWEKLTINSGMYFTEEILEKFEHKICWKFTLFDEMINRIIKGICDNESIFWSIDLLYKYKDKIYPNNLAYKEDYYEKVFKPYLNDNFIEKCCLNNFY
ncbi:MAG: hypothetical protein U0457_16630 [Candidatus Sericytochromatia bacterium]